MKSYFKNYLNKLLYEKKETLIPVIIISSLMGGLIERFLCRFNFGLLSLLVLLIIINAAVVLIYTSFKNYDQIVKNKVIKPLYFSLNFVSFEIFLYINYNDIKSKFVDIKLSFIPTEVYMVLLFTAAFILFEWILYIAMFSNVKMTKITTSGVEVQVDDTPLTEKQNQILNNLRSSIKKVMKTNGEMNKIAAEFILHNVIDSHREISRSYSYVKLFDCLRGFSNYMFGDDSESVIVDYKEITSLDTIEEEYNIPSNLYNKIYSRIDSLEDGKNDVFTERNLVFINYKFQSIYHEELRKNRIIGIIEFKDVKEGISDYGNLLIMTIKMFDYICALTFTSLYEGGGNYEES